MLVGIHQPHYMPWLRYLQKIAASDLFISLDDVSYTKNGWQNRNKIKCATGWMYLTVPVNSSLGQPICEIRIASNEWAEKHLNTLVTNYSKAPYFSRYIEQFTEIYRTQWTSLSDLNHKMLDFYLDALGIKTPVIRSSDLAVDAVSTDRLIGLCRAVGATAYFTGQYAVDAYLNVQAFEDAGIELRFQHWHCPEYPQLFEKSGFIPDLAIPDLLFNAGPGAIDLILEGGNTGNASNLTTMEVSS